MFSEYASRFLAQSQSRLLSSQTDQSPNRNPLDRARGGSSRAPTKSYLQRQPFSNPYGGSAQGSRFPFASRLTASNQPAPLFHSAADEFREEDDAEEHEREVADLYALQHSRRDFGASRLTESSESGDDEDGGQGGSGGNGKGRHAPGRGIRSSWTGDDSSSNDKQNDLSKNHGKRRNLSESAVSSFIGGARDRLVDVQLASTIHEDDEGQDQDHVSENLEDLPLPVQNFRRSPNSNSPFKDNPLFQREEDPEAGRLRAPSPGAESIPQVIPTAPPEAPWHDQYWATLYLICIATLFATFVLVLLHTSVPPSKIGDTVYTTIHASFYLLAIDSLVAVVVALLWLATLRSFVRPLVFGILVAVPVIAFAFTLYPFISSFKGQWHGRSVQDKAMRWLSFLPLIFGIVWTYTAYKSRHSLGRAIELLEFASKILAANPSLILVGFATLGSVVAWTWLWMLMFTRIFLGGHLSSSKTPQFILDASTWWLGLFFVLVYLWTLGILAGIQRSTTAATVSQWYFHRLVVPAPSSQRVVRASLEHAVTTIFGTICFSTLLALAVRLPLLVLPRRLGGYIAILFYSFIPASIATLTNPLTLTYGAIHSQPLSHAARGLAEMTFISANSPTTTLTPGAATQSAKPIYAYRLSKLLLHATRFVTALIFGFGGWVSTARMLRISDGGGSTTKGSLYAYIVGLIAGAIGWAVLGAMEGVLGGVLDAVVVCWGSEVGRGDGARGSARYCREADQLLGGDGQEGEGRLGLG